MMPHQPTDPSPAPQPTDITNYEGDSSNQPAPPAIEDSAVQQVVEDSGHYAWVPTTSHTAFHLKGKALEGGREGCGSPLWVIRAWHCGDLIPGKFSVRHNCASVPYEGKEIPVQNFEVLCAKPGNFKWVHACDGNRPPCAIAGGRTSNGETLYVGRAKYQQSITPGKVQPSHKCCYIGFAGNEIKLKSYEVLSRI